MLAQKGIKRKHEYLQITKSFFFKTSRVFPKTDLTAFNFIGISLIYLYCEYK